MADVFKDTPVLLAQHEEFALIYDNGKFWVVDIVAARKVEPVEVTYDENLKLL
jgi:hypothetical protein